MKNLENQAKGFYPDLGGTIVTALAGKLQSESHGLKS